MSSVFLLFFTLTSFAPRVHAYVEYAGYELIRYDYLKDYTNVHNVDQSKIFCKAKGMKLPTQSQLCPHVSDVQGEPNAPVGGILDGDQWVAVDDDVAEWLHVGTFLPYRNCQSHIALHNFYPAYWKNGQPHHASFANYVFCSTKDMTPLPTSNPSTSPSSSSNPTSSPISFMLEAYKDGCKNAIDFSIAFVTDSGDACNTCVLCEGSATNSILSHNVENVCINCNKAYNSCKGLKVTTTFETEWLMKFFTLTSSGKGAQSDPEKIILQASNDLENWSELYNSQLSFVNRMSAKDFLLLENKQAFKHYSITFVRKDTSSQMYLGNYGLVQAYTKSCISNVFADITGHSLLPYKE